MSSLSNSIRLQRLDLLNRAIELHGGRRDAFNALDPRDRIRILTPLKIAHFDWSTIKAKGLKGRLQEEIQRIVKELRSISDKPSSGQARTAAKLAAVSPGSKLAGNGIKSCISTSKKLTRWSQKSSKEILVSYIQNPYMAPYVAGMTLESIKKMVPEVQSQVIVRIQQRFMEDADETGLDLEVAILRSRGLSRLNLGPVALIVQKVRDQDLVEFFTSLISMNRYSSIKWPNISSISDDKAKAAIIRHWVRGNPSALDSIDQINCKYSGPDSPWRRLRTLPPEIGLFRNLEILHLEQNEISRLPPEIGKLSKLRELYLSHNRLKELPQELVNGCGTLKVVTVDENPLNYEYIIFGMLSLRSREEMEYGVRLLIEAAKTKGDRSLQDRFGEVVEKMEGCPLRDFLKNGIRLRDVDLMQEILDPSQNNTLSLLDKLSEPLRYRIFDLIQFLEKTNRGCIDPFGEGREAIVGQEKEVSDFSCSLALHLAFLEIAFVRGPKEQPLPISPKVLWQAMSLDGPLRVGILDQFNIIAPLPEPAKGQCQCSGGGSECSEYVAVQAASAYDRFLQQGLHWPSDAARIEAVNYVLRSFLKDMPMNLSE